MDIKVGSLVKSKAGRDKGKIFVVLAVDGGYVYMADGDLRKAQKPKKKKIIHLQPSGIVIDEAAEKILSGDTVTDSELRKALAQTGGK